MDVTNFIETVIGIIPKSWELLELEKTGDVIYGIQAAVANNTIPIGTKILTNVNINLDGNINLTKTRYYKLKSKRDFNTILKKGDILFNWRSGSKEHVGKTALFNLDGEYTHSSFILRIRPNEKINNEFLFYYLFKLRQSGYFMKMQDYSVNAKFNKSAINKLLVAVPPLPEQRNISNILSLIQSAIQKQEQIINTTTQLKNALMKKLFTEGMNNEPFKQTEVGLIPESWEVVKIGSLGKCVTGTTPKTSISEYYENAEYDFIAPADIGETKFVYNSIKQISEAGLNVVRHLPANSVLCVCIGSTIGKVGLTVKEKSATNQQLNSIICNKNYEPQFIYYLLIFYSHYWKTFSTPSPVPILSKGTFEKIDMPVTKNKDEQKEIVKTLSACDAKIEFHNKKKERLELIFSSALHHLMTGKLRVNVSEIEVIQAAKPNYKYLSQ